MCPRDVLFGRKHILFLQCRTCQARLLVTADGILMDCNQRGHHLTSSPQPLSAATITLPFVGQRIVCTADLVLQQHVIEILCDVAPSASDVRAGIKGIWNLRKASNDRFDTYLVLAFVGETRILEINAEDELDEAEIKGFYAEQQVRQSVKSSIRLQNKHSVQSALLDVKLGQTMAKGMTMMADCMTQLQNV